LLPARPKISRAFHKKEQKKRHTAKNTVCPKVFLQHSAYKNAVKTV